MAANREPPVVRVIAPEVQGMLYLEFHGFSRKLALEPLLYFRFHLFVDINVDTLNIEFSHESPYI